MSMGAEMLADLLIAAEIREKERQAEYAENLALVENGIWRMNNGKLIRISEMTDTHLINSIAMIEREREQISDLYIDLLLLAKDKMRAELSKRYPPSDPAFAWG